MSSFFFWCFILFHLKRCKNTPFYSWIYLRFVLPCPFFILFSHKKDIYLARLDLWRRPFYLRIEEINTQFITGLSKIALPFSSLGTNLDRQSRFEVAFYLLPGLDLKKVHPRNWRKRLHGTVFLLKKRYANAKFLDYSRIGARLTIFRLGRNDPH